MPETLAALVDRYLADQEYIEYCKAQTQSRDSSLLILQGLIQVFREKKISFITFTTQLELAIQTRKNWGTIGTTLIAELHKFNKYHIHTNSDAEESFRTILAHLEHTNVGFYIEEFYQFLLKERERLRRSGNTSSMIVTPSLSAFIISTFAFWLYPDNNVIIYSDDTRKGTHTLLKQRQIPPILNLNLTTNTIEVKTQTNYNAFQEINYNLLQTFPQINYSRYWNEYFHHWIIGADQTTSLTWLIKENDNSSRLAQPPTQPVSIQESNTDYDTTPQTEDTIDTTSPEELALRITHEPLQPSPEPLLTQLIHEVQRHVLIDETVIRRIYHALLAGHVIFTGPPGTGKTELARLIPETLWRSPDPDDTTSNQESDETTWTLADLNTETTYTTRLVTATDDWTPRTLISGITPQSNNGSVSYKIQFGHLTSTILKNWSFQGAQPEEWSHQTLYRTRLNAASSLNRSKIQTFKGQWLVIDEFNRAPIDLALGDALTALGGNDVLRVMIESGSAELPIPQDFRIIGTLNSFDRNYLNQMSEALKRRFSFIEILPPARTQRQAEQGIVLNKALKKISHLSPLINLSDDDNLYWQDQLNIVPDTNGVYSINWDDHQQAFKQSFDAAWQLFEVIRIYRQLGTAQAIALTQHMLITGVMQNYTTQDEWTRALDDALCNTIADQLQVLLPKELETLLLYLTTPTAEFPALYHNLLNELASSPQQLYRQLLALSGITDDTGQPFLSAQQVTQITAQDRPEIPASVLTNLFHLSQPIPTLPQFTRRLRTFWAERGL